MAHEVVERFPEGADQERKAKFAKDLIEALDKAGVKPGDDFYVMPTRHLDEIHDDCETKAQDLEQRLSNAEADADEYRSLAEAVEDYDRGILTKPELLEKAR